MDKQRLTTLINQPEKLNDTDFRDLTNLKNEYPYFQALSPLITIGSKKYSPQNEKKYLQSAAIYALDRKHLKEILTRDYISISAEKVKEESQKKKINAEEKNKVVGESIQAEEKIVRKTESTSDSKIEITTAPSSTHLPDSFFEELFKEMEALKFEKENYKKTLERFEARQSDTTENTSVAEKSTTKTKAASTKKTNETNSISKKASQEKNKESKKKSSTSKTKKAAKSSEKKSKNEEHDIIEELTSRKELKISDAHKKEQLNIINNFIDKEPVLTKRLNPDNQSNKQEAEDLSASSTNLSDDVVSETLAKLMIKQGRKQKAIDIYKKLIWKFPQKKTYFVEIIEELKKES